MCSKTIAKLVLIVTNLILFVAGGVLLGFGIAALVSPQELQKFISQIPNVDSFSNVIDPSSLMTSNAKFMIVVGAIIFFFSFLGCAGAMCEVKWMLFLYWISIVVLIILQLALIIFAAVSPSTLRDKTTTLMKEKWTSYQPEKFHENGTLRLPTDAVSLSWVAIQFKLGCCGISNYTDYNGLKWDRTYVYDKQTIEAVVPPSCCILEKKDIPTSELPEDYKKHLPECLKGSTMYINHNGCAAAVEELIVKYNYVPIIVCCVVILFELLAVACAVYLWRSTDSRKI